MDLAITIKPEPADTGYNMADLTLMPSTELHAPQPPPLQPRFISFLRPPVLANQNFSQTWAVGAGGGQTVLPVVIQPQQTTPALQLPSSSILNSETVLRVAQLQQQQQPRTQPPPNITVVPPSPASLLRFPARTAIQAVNSTTARIPVQSRTVSSASKSTTLAGSILSANDSIQMSQTGSIRTLVSLHVTDPAKSVCGLAYSARSPTVSVQQEFMCNFCHFKTEKMSSFSSHVSIHVFQCNHCLFKSFVRLELIAHKKEAHPEHSHELQGFQCIPFCNVGDETSICKDVTTTAVSSSATNNFPATSLLGSLGSSAFEASNKNSPSIDGAKSNSTSSNVNSKQYFTYLLHEDWTGAIKNLSCGLCSFKTLYMGGLMSHATVHKTIEINRDDNLAVWQCFHCCFASRHKTQVVAHIRHAHKEQSADGLLMRKLVWVKTTPNASVARDSQTESEGEWLWGCYYCTVNSTDRELVLAHENQEHHGSKLMITRKKLGPDEKVLWGIPSLSSPPKVSVASKTKTDLRLMPSKNTQSVLTQKSPDKTKFADMETNNDRTVSRRKQLLPRRVVDIDSGDPVTGTDSQGNTAVTLPNDESLRFVPLLVLDHVANDIDVDLSGYIQYDSAVKKGKCVACNYHVVGSKSLLEEHVLQAHINASLWKCPYCIFTNVRRFGISRHVKTRHRDNPPAILRRRPFDDDNVVTPRHCSTDTYEVVGQVSNEGSLSCQEVQHFITAYCRKKKEEEVQTTIVASQPVVERKGKISGPRTECERKLLKMAKKAWSCPYCARCSVFKNFIVWHMRVAHAEKRQSVTLKVVERRTLCTSKEESAEQMKTVVDLDARIILKRCPVDAEYESLGEQDAVPSLDLSKESLLAVGVDLDAKLVNTRRLSSRLLVDKLPYRAAELDSAPNSTTYGSSRNLVKEEGNAMKRLVSSTPRLEVSKSVYKCAYCDESCEQVHNIRQHLRDQHSENEPKMLMPGGKRDNFSYSCPFLACSLMTTLKKSLYAHLSRYPLHGRSMLSEFEQLESAKSTAHVNGVSKDVQPGSEGKMTQELTSELSEPDSDDEAWQPVLQNRKRKKRRLTYPSSKKRRVSGRTVGLPARHLSVNEESLATQVDEDNTALGCMYCQYESMNMCDMKEHLTSTHTHKDPVAVDLSAKKQKLPAFIYLCPLLFCNSTYKKSSVYHAHMRNKHPDVAPMTAARRLTAEKECEAGTESDCGVSTEQQTKTKTLDMCKELLRNKRQEKMSTASQEVMKAVKEAQKPLSEVTHFLCPYCGTQRDSVSSMKLHLIGDHADSAAVCHDVRRLTKWKKKYRIVVCTQVDCSFFAYTSDGLEEHTCGSAGSENGCTQAVEAASVTNGDSFTPEMKNNLSEECSVLNGQIADKIPCSLSNDVCDGNLSTISGSKGCNGYASSAVSSAEKDEANVPVSSESRSKPLLSIGSSSNSDSSDVEADEETARSDKQMTRALLANTRFKCPTCSVCFVALSEMKSHIHAAHQNESLFCYVDMRDGATDKVGAVYLCYNLTCDFSTDDENVAVLHRLSCATCCGGDLTKTDGDSVNTWKHSNGKDSSSAANTSVRSRNDDDKMYQCSFCNWITSNEPNIERHVKSEHGLSKGGYATMGLNFGNDGNMIHVVSVKDNGDADPTLSSEDVTNKAIAVASSSSEESDNET